MITWKTTSKLKRMVFTNIETGKLYHGMGYDIEMKIESTLTKISDVENFAKN